MILMIHCAEVVSYVFPRAGENEYLWSRSRTVVGRRSYSCELCMASAPVQETRYVAAVEYFSPVSLSLSLSMYTIYVYMN